MHLFEMMKTMGHEQLMFCHDEAAGYRAIIAIHSTKLGPAVGGARLWPYANDEEALIDALRLSRGMTYKSALAGLPFGGGKAVIIGDSKTVNREKLFRAHGRFVETLGGRYVTAEDVGTSTADMDIVRLETKHVAGLAARSGDPSPWTAHGVFRAMQAAAQYRWHSDHLAGKTVALQGCGNVGYCLAKELHEVGAKLIVTDISAERVQRVVYEFGATAVKPEAIYHVAAHIFAPCALGAILDDETIPQLQVEIIAGAANNQLREAKHGTALQKRGILYVPDYLANAGGVINGCIEMLNWEPAQAMKKVNAIYDTALDIFTLAHEQGIATSEAADHLAEQRLLRKSS
ncbi:MAG: Glu/Leu/Phe/Val dehydrogenase dimerization domain-containing protein [bacterium]